MQFHACVQTRVRGETRRRRAQPETFRSKQRTQAILTRQDRDGRVIIPFRHVAIDCDCLVTESQNTNPGSTKHTERKVALQKNQYHEEILCHKDLSRQRSLQSAKNRMKTKAMAVRMHKYTNTRVVGTTIDEAICRSSGKQTCLDLTWITAEVMIQSRRRHTSSNSCVSTPIKSQAPSFRTPSCGESQLYL